MSTWEPLPYPSAAAAQSFPMPDDDQIRNINESSGGGQWDNAPPAPDAFGFPSYPSDGFSNVPAYNPSASESSFAYPDPSLPYPPVPASGMPAYPSYPSEHYPPASMPMPPYSPGSESSSDGVNYVDDRDAPGKKGGLGKALNAGMRIANDALNRTDLAAFIGGQFPGQPRQPSAHHPTPSPSPYNPPYHPSSTPYHPSSTPYNPSPSPYQPPYNPSPSPYTPNAPSAPRDYTDGNASSRGHGTGKVGQFANQDYDKLKRSCLSSGRLFEDPEFPASNRLLVDGQSNYVVSYFGRGKFDANSIEWLRPGEICQRLRLNRGPEMYVNDLSRFDINQGEIGNCWFLAAMANLAENKACFQRVVPPDQSFSKGQYAGIFRFRFWRFGEWEEVVVDDRLPTRSGNLIYLRSVDKNEFWSALLEKAYAKLHGSYRALEGGLTIEAAVDFTGGIPELIDLSRIKMPPERLFYIMSKADDRSAFMGCALSNSTRVQEAVRLGLQTRHAYTITKVVEIRSANVRSGIPLVRIRNPHGNSKEWKGEWSDDDRNWRAIPTHMRQQLGLTFEDDGEFYMSFRDFLKYFGELEICHLNPDSLEVSERTKRFEVFNFYGSWKAGRTAGGCGNDGFQSFMRNPQFFINLNDPDPYDDETQCSVVISLAQRQLIRKKEHAIGFKIYKCDANTRTLDDAYFRRNNSIDRTDSFINLREVSKRLVLAPGRYCIVPCTFARGEEGDFLLRVFIEKRWGRADGVSGQTVTDAVDGGNAGYNLPGITDGFGNIRIGGGGGHHPQPQPNNPYGPGPNRPNSGADKFVGFALRQLETFFPEHAKGLRNLQKFYNWVSNADAEYDLLKTIVGTIKKK